MVRRPAWLLGLFGLSAISSVEAHNPGVPVVSLASDGSAQVRVLPQNEYLEVLQGAVGSVHDSVMPQLDAAVDHGTWKLNTISVGVGIQGQVGLGPIISVQAKPRIRLIYTRLKEPHFP